MKLFNTFIRSVVNQVGRDTGKVISNKIFKDSHAAPIRITQAKNNKEAYAIRDEALIHLKAGDGTKITIPKDELTDEYIRASGLFKLKIIDVGCFHFLGIVGMLFIPIVGPLYWLASTIDYSLRKKVSYHGIEFLNYFVEDKRTNLGFRKEGLVTDQLIMELTPNKAERVMLNIFAALCFVMMLLFGGFQYWVWLNWES